MDIKSFPNNQNLYTGAQPVMKWLHGRTSGVYPGDNYALVEAVSNSMAVTVRDGVGWLSNANHDGIVWWNDTQETTGTKLRLSIAAADSTRGRIDRIVVSWPTTNYAAYPTITVLKGTASSSPVPPALTNNSVMRQISLAQISVPAKTTAMSPLLVLDEREDRSVCGYVTNSVEVDAADIHAVLQALRTEVEAVRSGSGFELKSVVVSNVSVAPSMVVPTTDTDIAYPYTLRIPVSAAAATHTPEVFFKDVQASSGTYGSVAKAIAGYVLVGANGIPDASFAIPMIALRRY